MAEDSKPVGQRRRRRWQFSLKALVVFCIYVCLGLLIWQSWATGLWETRQSSIKATLVSIDFCPNGKLLVLATDSGIMTLNSTTLRVINEIGGDAEFSDVIALADNRHVAVAGRNKLHICDLDHPGTPRLEISLEKDLRNQAILFLGHAPNRREIYFLAPFHSSVNALHDSGPFYTWNTSQNTIKQLIPRVYASHLSFQPKNLLLAYVHPNDLKTALLRHCASNKVDKFKIDLQSTSCLKFTPDGSILVSGHYNGNIHFFDFRKNKILHSISLPSGMVDRIAFSRDSKTLAAVSHSDNFIYIYRAPWTTSPGKIPHDGKSQFALSPNGDKLVAWTNHLNGPIKISIHNLQPTVKPMLRSLVPLGALTLFLLGLWARKRRKRRAATQAEVGHG